MAKKQTKELSVNYIKTYSYSIRKAIEPRKSFALQRTHTDPTGKKIHEKYTDDVLKSVNETYLNSISENPTRKSDFYNNAIVTLTKHLAKLKMAQKVDCFVADETKKAIKKFLKFKSEQVEIGKIRYTTLDKLKFECDLLESLLKGENLLTIAPNDLYKFINQGKLANSTKNKLVVLCNSIRKHSGITTKIATLGKGKKLTGAVDFISPVQQKLILNEMSKIDYHITKFGIATGLREGELFGLTTKSLKGNYLYITTQLYRDDQEGNPKNNRERLVPLSKVANESYKYLMAHLKQFKAQRRTYSSRLRRISKKVLNHSYSTYDLRHTFAIECLKKGLTPITVCSWMGNSLIVFQNHYVGYMNKATPEELLKLNA